MTPHAEVIGDPIAHSKSPLIHGFWLDALGIEARYAKTHVVPHDLAGFIDTRRTDPGWRGCNVTVPHKQAVMPLLDAIDPLATRIGAVNTVVVEDGRLVGHNTDAAGFLEPIAGELRRTHLFRMARLLGNGGAARAVVHALADHHFTVVVIARDTEKSAALLAGSGLDPSLVAPLDSFAPATDFAWDDRTGVLDLFVNATSLGMTGSAPLAVHPSHIPPGAVVYDLVYAPLETRLLADARARGHATIDGLAMLIGQAAAAFERFFGQPAPRNRDADLRALLTAS